MKDIKSMSKKELIKKVEKQQKIITTFEELVKALVNKTKTNDEVSEYISIIQKSYTEE